MRLHMINRCDFNCFFQTCYVQAWKSNQRYKKTGVDTFADPGQKGFTLLELMVTVSVLGILVAIATPSISRWLENAAISNASSTLVAHLKQARHKAIASNQSINVQFTTSGYTLDACTVAGSEDCSTHKPVRIALSSYSSHLSLIGTTPVNLTFTSSSMITPANIELRSSVLNRSEYIAVNATGGASL